MRAVKGIFIVIALLLVTPQARADDVAVKMFLKKGDRQYKKRTDPKAVDKAKSYYEKVLAVDPDNVKARWKLARLFYWKGTHAKGKAAKMKIFEQGIRYAQEGIQKNSKSIGCHYWLGVSYGKFGEAKGILASLDLVPHLKKEMETVLKLKEGYEYGGAHRVLCRRRFRPHPGTPLFRRRPCTRRTVAGSAGAKTAHGQSVGVPSSGKRPTPARCAWGPSGRRSRPRRCCCRRAGKAPCHRERCPTVLTSGSNVLCAPTHFPCTPGPVMGTK